MGKPERKKMLNMLPTKERRDQGINCSNYMLWVRNETSELCSHFIEHNYMYNHV